MGPGGTMRNRLGTLLLAFSWACGLAQATQVRLLDLEQMTDRAARIFAGRCLHTEVMFDDVVGARVTVATFQVQRAIKGVQGHTVTVRMLSTAAGPGSLDAVDRFRPGEEVVLFLYGDSALGLTAPVGLGQGRFQVVTDKQGHRRALNEIGNRNVLRRTGRGPEDALEVTTLLDRVERRVQER